VCDRVAFESKALEDGVTCNDKTKEFELNENDDDDGEVDSKTAAVVSSSANDHHSNKRRRKAVATRKGKEDASAASDDDEDDDPALASVLKANKKPREKSPKIPRSRSEWRARIKNIN
jgi:hypothetical protein